jgi:hypothetical protein
MPSKAPMLLPISIVTPTRDSMDRLPRHLTHHQAVFAHSAEIIHCDSFSKDATKQYVATHLNHPNLRQLDHPPGLYQSWNFAIGQCTQPYIYISTVGDTIDLDGIRQLLALAQTTQADVVISPPKYVEESGETNDYVAWPIDNLIRLHNITQPGIVQNHLVYTEAVLHAPDGILGSSASCLYRTDFIKTRPFPMGFRGACDSVWALQFVPEARCAILPKPISTFLLHPKTYESHRLVNAQIGILVREHLQKLIAELLEDAKEATLPRELLAALQEYNRLAVELAHRDDALIKLYKKLRFLWPLCPPAWFARSRRNQQRRLVRAQAANVRASLQNR